MKFSFCSAGIVESTISQTSRLCNSEWCSRYRQRWLAILSASPRWGSAKISATIRWFSWNFIPPTRSPCNAPITALASRPPANFSNGRPANSTRRNPQSGTKVAAQPEISAGISIRYPFETGPPVIFSSKHQTVRGQRQEVRLIACRQRCADADGSRRDTTVREALGAASGPVEEIRRRLCIRALQCLGVRQKLPRQRPCCV